MCIQIFFCEFASKPYFVVMAIFFGSMFFDVILLFEGTSKLDEVNYILFFR